MWFSSRKLSVSPTDVPAQTHKDICPKVLTEAVCVLGNTQTDKQTRKQLTCTLTGNWLNQSRAPTQCNTVQP